MAEDNACSTEAPRAGGRHDAAQRTGEVRCGLRFAASFAAALASSPAGAQIEAACAGLVEVLGAQRCSIWSEDDADTMLLRDVALAPPRVPRLPLVSSVAISDWLAALWRERPAGWTQQSGVVRDGGALVSVLTVALGGRAAFVLERSGAAGWSQEEIDTVQVIAALAEQPAREARRAREEREGMATSAALRNLLEMGIQARSAIEAAKALASTAAQVLDFPVGCAYLVGEDGIITEVVSVGADEEHAERLRVQLVGKQARGSPVWRRTVEGPEAGPDLIDDTARSGVVRTGGVAQALDLRSLAAIPLLSSDGPLGLVLCGDHAPRRRWRRGDRELLARLSLEGAVVVDNARLREAERHEATHDALTGLPNRRAFAAALHGALAAAPGTAVVAVLLLDLDRFKEVNDHLGHHRGDELLVAVAERLRSGLGPVDLLARLGGDEFAVLLCTPSGARRAEQVARQIAELLDDPFAVGDLLLHVDASVGIARAPEHALDADGLLQRSDAAMYTAKRSGVDFAVYGPEVAAESAAEIGLLGELRRAISGGTELALHYQPKVELATGAVTGVEALVRWQHPRRGLLGPERFVPLAEETGIIRALTNWVVPEALHQLAQWRARGLDVPVSVNISARDLADARFPLRVAGWLAESKVPGDRLVIEVTEGTLVRDRGAASAALERLRRLGVRISLDDFGTGYSSLAYLEALPVDELKIDREFLRIARARGAVVRAIASLGHALHMTVVAEGVETAEHAAWLAEMECDEAQGYLFSRPVPPEELEHWLLAKVEALAL